MHKRSRFIALVAALAVVTGVSVAYAQVTTYVKSGTSRAGIVVPVFSGLDSVIVDGTVVMVDTTTAATTNQQRIVVVPYNGVVLNRYRFLGVAAGDIKKPGNATTGHRGAPGNVLIWGFHPNAKIGISAQAGGVPLKVGPLYGKFGTAADTVSLSVGYIIGPAPHTTPANPRSKVFITAHGLTLN
jgi:hypothetical protein